MNKNKIILSGLHKERHSKGQLVELNWLNPDDNKYHLSGYEIQEYSNDKQQWISLGYFVNKMSATTAFNKYFRD